MKELLILLRAQQLMTHQAHHLVARMPFLPDHELLSDLYTAADKNYDNVAERLIGLMGEEALPDLNEQLPAIQALVAQMPQKGVKENAAYMMAALDMQKRICVKIEELVKSGLPQGTIQLLGDIANESETFQYKLKQRLKK